MSRKIYRVVFYDEECNEVKTEFFFKIDICDSMTLLFPFDDGVPERLPFTIKSIIIANGIIQVFYLCGCYIEITRYRA